jgi:prophage antirepressor-like protein
MEQMKTLIFESRAVRTINREGEMWWVLKDVCDVLEISNPSVVADRLDEDERSKFDLGRQGEAIIISESGLYSVILRSDKPKAKPFRKWVTGEVLPSIRKTGEYSITLPDNSPVNNVLAMEHLIADYWISMDEKYVKLQHEISEMRFEKLSNAFRKIQGEGWLKSVPPELLEQIDEVFRKWGEV